MRAADAVLRYLQNEGVRYVFGNPGTTEVPLMDALVDSPIEFVLCLQENAAVAAADGLAQASRRVQVANLHTGPGLAQAYSALYMASAHRSPLVVTAGQEDTRFASTQPLLHAPLVEMARPLVKWAHEPHDVDDVIPSLRRAVKVAATPPTGPVFLSWPMDVLAREVSDDTDLRPADIPSPPAPDPETVRRVAELLAAAENPCFVAGDDVGRTRSVRALAGIAESLGAGVFGAPLSLTQNFPSTHPLWRGGLPPFPAVARSFLDGHDVIVVVGARAFFLYYYQPVEPVPPGAKLVHVHPDGWEVGKNYATEVGIVSTADLFLSALAREVGAASSRESGSWMAQAGDSEFTPASIITTVYGSAAGTDVTFVDESVTSSFAVRASIPLPDEDSFFGHKGGALGWGAGAAVGVALAYPGRRIVCTLGDGSLMYGPQALWTAARLKLPILYLVLNNAGYAIIKAGTRAAKGRSFETGTYVGMDIAGPEVDFVALARGLGCGAGRAATTGELRVVLKEAFEHEGPFLIDCAIDRAIPDLPF